MKQRAHRRIERLEAEAARVTRAPQSDAEVEKALAELRAIALEDRPSYRQLVIQAAEQTIEYAENIAGIGIRFYEEVHGDRDFRHEMQDVLAKLGSDDWLCWCRDCFAKWNARHRSQ